MTVEKPGVSRENSQIIFSRDEGKTWTDPRPLPNILTGDRHTAAYTPDGRLIISFRDVSSKHNELRKMAEEKGITDLDDLARKVDTGSPTEGECLGRKIRRSRQRHGRPIQNPHQGQQAYMGLLLSRC